MNILDLVILGMATLAAVRGLRRGLGREAIGLGASALLLFAGLPLTEPLGQLITEWWPPAQPYAALLGLVALVGLVALAVWLLTIVWHGLMKALSLRWLDALGGAVFGLAKVAAVWLVIVALLSWLPSVSVQRALAGSLAAGALLQVLPTVLHQVEKLMPPAWSLPKPPPRRRSLGDRPGWPQREPAPDSWQQVEEGRRA